MSRRDSDSEKVPAALYDRLTDTPTYAARMYKVQLREYEGLMGAQDYCLICSLFGWEERMRIWPRHSGVVFG